MARAEQRMRVEALTEKAMAELGLEPEVLVAEYGPDQPVPVLTGRRHALSRTTRCRSRSRTSASSSRSGCGRPSATSRCSAG